MAPNFAVPSSLTEAVCLSFSGSGASAVSGSALSSNVNVLSFGTLLPSIFLVTSGAYTTNSWYSLVTVRLSAPSYFALAASVPSVFSVTVTTSLCAVLS